MTGDLDVESLRLLIAVSETGSLSQAAASRGMSQPAASARVKEFEARWQLGVIRRSPRGSRLTTDGEAVVAWAGNVLYAVDTMRRSMIALSAEQHGGVVIAASLTIAEQLMPRWLGELHDRYPAVQPLLQVVNSHTVATTVTSGDADIGFIESVVLPVNLTQQTVGRDRLVVVACPGHRWARRRTPVTREELLRERWVLREQGSGTRSTFEAALRQQPQLAMEGASTAALLGAAAAGVGPAVVSSLTITAEIETRRLVLVPTELDLVRPLTAVWRTEERLRKPAADLLSIAMAEYT